MSVVIARSQDIFNLVAEDAQMEQLGTGCMFTEGPAWHWAGGYLLFSDIPADRMKKWSPNEGITDYRVPSGMSNGLTFDEQGRLIACEHAKRRVSRTEHDGTIVTLASHYNGKTLNSPNDVVVRSDGSIYFTDPPYGLVPYYGIERPQELPFQGVYRIAPSGELQLLIDDFDRPNGLAFSPDESILYIDDTARMHIRAFDVKPDGTLANGRVFAVEEGEGGAPDGLKVDVLGNVYCTGPGGIWVFDPKGRHLGIIQVPEHTANLAWGDSDWKSLYITATSSIYRIRMKVAGTPALMTWRRWS